MEDGLVTDEFPATPPIFISGTPRTKDYEVSAGDWKKYYAPEYDGSTDVKVYDPRVATIKGACFKADIWDTWVVNSTGYLAFRTWQNRKSYPDRLVLPTIKTDVAIQALDETFFSSPPTTHFGVPKIGTLFIDLVFGTIGFKPT